MRYLKTYEKITTKTIVTAELINLLDLEKDYLPISKVKKLLDNGADINAHDIDDNYGSILNMATYRNDLELIKFLVQNGADINSFNSCGSTSIYIASHNGYKDIIEFLIENGADINIPNDSGVLPIQTALGTRHDDIATILLKAGSDLRTEQYNDISLWIKNKDYNFQKTLCELHPDEIIKIDTNKIHKNILKDYEHLFAANKYNI